jgi:hypothetical protein
MNKYSLRGPRMYRDFRPILRLPEAWTLTVVTIAYISASGAEPVREESSEHKHTHTHTHPHTHPFQAIES